MRFPKFTTVTGFFYQKLLDEKEYTEEMQEQDAMRFETYLKRYFKEIVEPNNGVMVYLGHPMYSGYSDITMKPLNNLFNFFKDENVWVTTPNEVAYRWNKLRELKVEATEKGNQVHFKITLANDLLKGFTIKLDNKPKSVTCDSKYSLIEKDNQQLLILDVNNKAEVTINY